MYVLVSVCASMCGKGLGCNSSVSKILNNYISTVRGRRWSTESGKARVVGSRRSKNLKIVSTSLWLNPTFKVSFFFEECFHEKLYQRRSYIFVAMLVPLRQTKASNKFPENKIISLLMLMNNCNRYKKKKYCERINFYVVDNCFIRSIR